METKAERFVQAKRNAPIKVREFLDAVCEADMPCEHGHFGCSTTEEGPCSDEVHALACDAGIVAE